MNCTAWWGGSNQQVSKRSPFACCIPMPTLPTKKAIGRALHETLPGLFVSLSSQVLPQMREYERTSTTVINSYVGPPVRQYLQSMIDQFAEAGIHGRFMVMQSSGGILDASAVLDRPSQIVECGPAAGVVGAAVVGRRSGYDHLITFDMGGTTAKVVDCRTGEPAHGLQL